MNTYQAGFTLVELMVATAITGILAATAYPSFQGPIYKARRIDGITSLLELQLRQERWRSGHSQYADQAELRASTSSPQRFYELRVADATATGFSAIAVASGAQSGDRACRVLRLTVAEGDIRHTSGADETASNSATDNKRCWSF